MDAFRRDSARIAEIVVPSAATLQAPIDSVGIPVYYASTRPWADLLGVPYVPYLFRADSGLVHYGRAVVSIPAGHRPGQEDGRGWCRYLGPLRCQRNASNSITVIDIAGLSDTDWVQGVSKAIGDSGQAADVLLFVHGFDNDFQSAVRAAAQISYDVGFRGVTATFDWVSANSVAHYTSDQESAERSVAPFEQFLRTLFTAVPARHVYVVAHSMGTRLVSYAIRDLVDSTIRNVPDSSKWSRLGQVIFAASDVDSAIFVDQYADKLERGTRHVTLYASSQDRALKISASSFVHGGQPRVGSGPPSIILHDGMDYVDASIVDTDLIGHGYFRENQVLIDDIFYILRHELPASERALKTVRVDSRRAFYRFP